MSDNMYYYNAMRSVPVNAQRNFNNGRFSGTDINGMWRIKRMTEMFGPCGIGWYVDIRERHMEKSPDGQTVAAFVALNLYVRVDGEWSKPIYGEGGNTFATVTKSGYAQVSDEAYKMAYTDAFSNATKQLGLAADIWFEKDVSKYTQSQQSSQASQTILSAEQKADIARKFLDNNTVALQYYLKKYNCGQMEDLQISTLAVIHDELRRNNKI